jgi:hypothetical protein
MIFLRLQKFLLALIATAVWSAAAASPPAAPAGAQRGADPLPRIERALDAGDVHTADSLFTAAERAGGSSSRSASGSPSSGSRHRREILAARLAAGRGDWKGTEARLRTWASSPTRGEGSGEILFWQGWAALHQARAPEADSLFVLASAYAEEARAQDALEYRFAALLESEPEALGNYLRGLPESPLPANLRAASLAQVSSTSRLYPQARWHLALVVEALGDTLRARELLQELARDPSPMAGRRALLTLAVLREKNDSGRALETYEALLLKHQQGILAEFARKRVQGLRKSPSGSPP